jgi:23S rRNA pseudouridine1911/1915/1917 synthase
MFHPRELTADRGDAGQRLDLVLSRHLADVSVATRARIQRWIADGLVAVNGAATRRVSRRVAAGDVVIVTLPALAVPAVMAPESSPVVVRFEDASLLIVDKAPGVVCHPTHAHAAGTLMNALLWEARAWPKGQRPSLVGRLDKWTSGLVLVAKTARVHAALQRTLANGDDSLKEYVALVYGAGIPERGQISLRLSRDETDRRRVTASTTVGAFSLTTFELVASVEVPNTTLSVVRCRIATGRTHQIRVHLAARNWPIAGDPVYGEPRWRDVLDQELSARLQAFPRQALHASRLAFDHPESGERVDVSSPLPEDMRELLGAVGVPQGQPGKW